MFAKFIANRVFCFIIMAFPLKLLKLIYIKITERIHKIGPDYLTVCYRPKNSDVVLYSLVDKTSCYGNNKIGIVLQGSLCYQDDLTLETVRLYKKLCPDCEIIVSTWIGENSETVKSIINSGAIVLLNEIPKNAGRLNVNFQVKSTISGINKAVSLGCSYIAKTRCDYRIYAAHKIPDLIAYCLSFPSRYPSGQFQRIVSISHMTRKYHPFHLSDIFLFGHKDDMLSYWNQRLDDGSFFERNLIKAGVKIDCILNCKVNSPETFLLHGYLNNIKYKSDDGVKGWWKVLQDLFVIIDWSALNIYWPKYMNNSENFTNEYINDWPIQIIVKEIDWIAIYASDLEDIDWFQLLDKALPCQKTPLFIANLNYKNN